MAFPLGWPPRAASGVRTFRFYSTGTSSTDFADNAFLFFSGNMAFATIGGLDINGLVLSYVDTAGVAGNDYTIEVQVPDGGASALSAAFVPAGSTNIVVKLAKLVSGELNNAANTATLVAAAVNALAGVTSFANGTGATSLKKAEAQKNFFGAAGIIQPTPFIGPGAATTTVHVGTYQAGGSPMGGGQRDSGPSDYYRSPAPMVWANTIVIGNDDGTATNTLEFSFDGINVQGKVRGGSEFVMRNRSEAGVAVRAGAGTPAFRIHAW